MTFSWWILLLYPSFSTGQANQLRKNILLRCTVQNCAAYHSKPWTSILFNFNPHVKYRLTSTERNIVCYKTDMKSYDYNPDSVSIHNIPPISEFILDRQVVFSSKLASDYVLNSQHLILNLKISLLCEAKSSPTTISHTTFWGQKLVGK